MRELSSPENGFQFLLATEQCNERNWHGRSDIHTSHLLLHVISGQIEGEVSGQPVSLSSGSTLWVNPGVSRGLRLKKGVARSRNYRLRFRLLDGPENICLREPFVLQHDTHTLTRYFQILAGLHRQNASLLEKRAVLLACFAGLLEGQTASQQEERRFTRSQKQQIDEAFSSPSGQACQTGTLAGQMGYSTDYFTRLFKSTYGSSPRTYRKICKLRLAAELLLESSYSLKEICHLLEEGNLSKFCRQFKEHYRCTPTEYRRNG